jgi:hypothetical protein
MYFKKEKLIMGHDVLKYQIEMFNFEIT